VTACELSLVPALADGSWSILKRVLWLDTLWVREVCRWATHSNCKNSETKP
jgi:hypothetical protein